MNTAPTAPLESTWGFTLVEILVAMTLLAIVGLLSYRGLDSMQQTTAHVQQTAQRWQAISRALERFTRDVQQPARRPGRQEDGSAAPAWWGRAEGDDGLGSAQLVFSRLGNEGMDTQRLGYRWRNGRWEMLFWNSPESPAGQFEAYPLLEGVELLELQYLDPRGFWQTTWPQPADPNTKQPPNPFPRAVRLSLELAEGGKLERIVDIPAAE